MKVLHVVPSLDSASGGPARSVPGLCSAEARAGAEVSFISFASREPTVIEGVETINLKPIPGTRQGLTWAYLSAVSRVVRSIDIVHVHSLWNPPVSVAMSIAKRAFVPYVISPRGMLHEVSLTRKATLKRVAAALGERNRIRAAAGVHFLTREEASASKSFALPQDQIVLPNGVELDLKARVSHEAFRTRVPELDNRKIVLFLGRLHWSKGLDIQLEAVARLAAHRDDFTWLLIGPDEGEWASLSKAIERRGLTGTVRWLGPLPHQACLEATSAASLMIMTSRHEAHSMAMNEALALSTPLVMTDTVNFPALADARAALVVEPDPSSIATAMGRILDDELLASQLRDSGTTFVRRFLAWPLVAEQMIAFYEALLTRRPTVNG